MTEEGGLVRLRLGQNEPVVEVEYVDSHLLHRVNMRGAMESPKGRTLY